MQIELAFGKSGLTVELPEGPDWHVLEPRSATPLANVDAALAAALGNPVGTPPLAELARGKRTAAISVCDITRPAPNATTLPPLLERLHAGGIPREGVTILIATGLHRTATPAEIEAILGQRIAAEYRVINHFAKDLAAHAELGKTRRGTPVFIQKEFIEADLHITLGFIEQHLMAGFSGGRKLIAPGLAAQETIKVLHSPAFMREPLAIEGSIEANPLHAELIEIAAMARHDFMLDVVLTPEREIAGVFAGSGMEAHAAGVEFVRRALMERLAEAADAVLTTAAGYPLDLTFYQMVKGVTAAQHLVKPGGRILVMAECAEGVGAPEFAARVKRVASLEASLDEMAHTPVEVDQWQLEKLALAGRRCELLFYTPGVAPEAAGALASRMYRSPEAAVRALVDGLRPGARVLVIPEGPYVFAQVAEMAGNARK
ncbi:MAG TPA: nickel-dependent lactate racemase [Terracidiphilus sp.]|jgi:nickel-dependent lactate racemase|nr:nickel-dependent lactate racemase [Terracidiphilus sp.]